jgi:hypothetical protein
MDNLLIFGVLHCCVVTFPLFPNTIARESLRQLLDMGAMARQVLSIRLLLGV